MLFVLLSVHQSSLLLRLQKRSPTTCCHLQQTKVVAQYEMHEHAIRCGAEQSYAACVAAAGASVITASEAAKPFTKPSFDMLPPTTSKYDGSTRKVSTCY